jgi:hypothetical protein
MLQLLLPLEQSETGGNPLPAESDPVLHHAHPSVLFGSTFTYPEHTSRVLENNQQISENDHMNPDQYSGW